MLVKECCSLWPLQRHFSFFPKGLLRCLTSSCQSCCHHSHFISLSCVALGKLTEFDTSPLFSLVFHTNSVSLSRLSYPPPQPLPTSNDSKKETIIGLKKGFSCAKTTPLPLSLVEPCFSKNMHTVKQNNFFNYFVICATLGYVKSF